MRIYKYIESYVSVYKNYLNEYIKKSTVDFENSNRDKNKILFQKYAGEKVSNCNAIVILVAKNHNIEAVSEKDLKILSAEGHKIIIKEVCSIQEIDLSIKEFKAQNIKIKSLVLHAHGKPTLLHLGDDNFLSNTGYRTISNKSYNRNVDQLKNALSQVEENGSIILNSCSNGHVNRNGAPCLAQTIATLAPGRLVVAPIKALPHVGTAYKWDNGKLTSTFTNVTNYNFNAKRVTEHIKNSFYLIKFYLGYRENITAYFRSVKKIEFKNPMI